MQLVHKILMESKVYKTSIITVHNKV